MREIELANAFSAIIREWFADAPATLREINRRNKNCDENHCATHDFSDSNMAMLDAWIDIFGCDIDLKDEAQLALWGRAWRLAKAAQFQHITERGTNA